ncbi:hypothetical protein L596_011825 [Steinernema carpocapsae]|uniref:Lysozyme n=1 Tax=Steinernema carpocapsae TaxID=34508 RepID=A0A4V6A4L4_STECR|nr:hypothetical protein L596_011825 [Steinernema carpocapsae]
MKTLALFCTIVASALSAPLSSETDSSRYNYAIDVAQTVSAQTFKCIFDQGYKTAFVRVYKPDGTGSVDQAGVQNVFNAHNGRLGTEVYVTPSVQSNKQASQQFNEVQSALQQAGIGFRTVWLQVTSPINWGSNQQFNIQFISEFFQAAQAAGVNVGVYTNWYDWSQITGSWSGWSTQQAVQLWYWSAYGVGPSVESPSNFNDFRAFGGWTQGAMKQFGLQSNVCGVTFNRNAYSVSSYAAESRSEAAVEKKAGEKVVVGTLFG